MKPAGFWPSISTGRPGRRTPGPSWPPATKWPYPRPWKGPAPGKGGHVWLFFKSPVPASLARKLGCAILTRTLEERHQLGLDSYDRFFPNQDTLPKGGFGNLIALPLQWGPRETGNSVFLNPDGDPYPDQWLFLSGLDRLPVEAVETLVGEASRAGKIISVRQIPTDEQLEEDPWPDVPSGRRTIKPLSRTLAETDPSGDQGFGLSRQKRVYPRPSSTL